MGSMFEEMKKVKKYLQKEKSNAPSQQVNVTHIDVPRSAREMLACPTCGRMVPIHSLKSHLDAEHKIIEGPSLYNATPMLPGRKPLSQHPFPGPQKPKSQPIGQKQLLFGPLNRTNQQVARGRHQETRLEGLDRNKNLDGYTELVMKLPNGQDHTIFFKRTVHPLQKQNNRSATRGRAGSNDGSKTSTSALQSISSKQDLGEIHIPFKEKSLSHAEQSFPLSNPVEFKIPDDWVAMGAKTTLQPSGKSFTVRMGIDFGTAFTKASIGYGDDIFIVDWAGIKNGLKNGPAPFTLPGEFSVLPDGSCVVGRAQNAVRVATDLKLPFLEDRASRCSLIDATIFLSLVMRYIRGWWFHHHKDMIKKQAIEWNINLGAPTTPWQNGSIRHKYEKAAQMAWITSCSAQTITVDHAERVFDSPGRSSPPVEIVPEFVAQIASYTRSAQRQRDLHLLVDVGAGTVDVVTFNVHRDDQSGEDIFPIFCASISNLGTHYLMLRRMNGFQDISKKYWSDAATVESAPEFAQKLGITIQDVVKIDSAHANDVAAAIASVLLETKRKRYCRSPNWEMGIRVFFCGGGSSNNTFEQSISLASTLSGVPLACLRLPLPNHLKAPSLPPDQFHRVSVAYGLGLDVFNLGQIRSSAEIEDDTVAYLPLRPYNTDFEDK